MNLRRDSEAAPVRLLDAVLPQTQCQRCGYPDCLAYARAMAMDGAAINRCPPGGEETIAQLSDLTGAPPRALDPECGGYAPRRLAEIDEQWCIGCTKCIQACPVDAIVGAPKRMHVVLQSLCTGCELCVAPCPVECIELTFDSLGPATPRQWLAQRAGTFRVRYRARVLRLERRAEKRAGRRGAARRAAAGASSPDRSATIAAAVRRKRSRREGHGTRP